MTCNADCRKKCQCSPAHAVTWAASTSRASHSIAIIMGEYDKLHVQCDFASVAEGEPNP